MERAPRRIAPDALQDLLLGDMTAFLDDMPFFPEGTKGAVHGAGHEVHAHRGPDIAAAASELMGDGVCGFTKMIVLGTAYVVCVLHNLKFPEPLISLDFRMVWKTKSHTCSPRQFSPESKACFWVHSFRVSKGDFLKSPYIRQAENILYQEIGAALGIQKDQVLDYLIGKIEGKC